MDIIVDQHGVRQADLGDRVYNVIGGSDFDRFFEPYNLTNDSGVVVTPTSAMTYSSVFQAVQVISGDVARVALDVFERQNDDSRRKRRNHPAYKLLNKRANPYVSGYYLRETLQSHALLWGNGYAQIIRDNIGRPTSLELLHPSTVEPVVRDDGVLVYEVRIDGKLEATLSYYEVLHIKGLGDGVKGFSVVSLARNSWGLGMASEKHGAKFFKKGARPNLVLKHPMALDKAQADTLLDNFEARHSGSDGVGRPALAAGGLDIVPLSMSNQDSQWLQTREFQRVEVASWFSLPPHKLGDSSRMAYSSIEAEERSYTSQTLMRWFERWESEVDMKLLTERQYMSDWYSEHNVDALIQGDTTTQANTAVALRNAMIITQNEARKKFNLPSVEGGDSFENPATSSGRAPDTPPQVPDTTQAKAKPAICATHHALIRDRMEQFIRTEVSQVKRLCSKAKNVAESLENFYGEYRQKVVEGLSPCVRANDAMTGKATGQSEIERVVDAHFEESQASLLAILEHETPQELLASEVDESTRDWASSRSEKAANLLCGVDDE